MDNRPTPGFVTCDGEGIQLKSAITSTVLNALKEADVSLGKVSASCTAIHQPSDVSALFRALKSRLTAMRENGVDILPNPALTHNLLEAMKSFKKDSKIPVSSDAQAKIVTGCLVITQVVQDVVRPSMIRDGFQNSGQYPLSFDKVMGQCYETISPAQMQAMELRTAVDVEQFLQHGELTEMDLNISNIPTIADGGKDRNERPLSNQRAVVLSNPATIKRYLEFINKGFDLGDALIQEQEPEQELSMQEAVKLVAADRDAKAKKEAEKARKALQTAQEKALETQNKKAAAEAKRQQKAARLNQATAMVAGAVA